MWSIASFSRMVMVPHNAEVRMASRGPGRRSKRRSGARMPVRASSTSGKEAPRQHHEERHGRNVTILSLVAAGVTPMKALEKAGVVAAFEEIRV